MIPLWDEMRAAFDGSSDTRMIVVGGLSGGVGGAVGTLAETGNLYEQLALTGAVAVLVALVLLVGVTYLGARGDADDATG